MTSFKSEVIIILMMIIVIERNKKLHINENFHSRLDKTIVFFEKKTKKTIVLIKKILTMVS